MRVPGALLIPCSPVDPDEAQKGYFSDPERHSGKSDTRTPQPSVTLRAAAQAPPRRYEEAAAP